MIAFLRELLQLISPRRRVLVLLVVVTAIGELIMLPWPFLFAWLIERIDTEVQARDFVVFVIGILLMQTLQGGVNIYRARLNRQFALDAANELRNTFFVHLLRMPYSHFLETHPGTMANNYLNDIDDIDRSIANFVELGLRSLLLLVFFGIAIVIWNPVVGILALCLAPTTVYGQRRVRWKMRENSRDKVDLRERVVGLASEAVANIPLVKSFTLEPAVEAYIGNISERYRDVDVALETRQSLLRSTATVILVFSQYAFFGIGAWMVMTNRLGLGAFLGQVLIFGRFIPPLNNLMEYYNQLNQSQAALFRVRGTLAQPLEGAAYPRPLESLHHTGGGVLLEVEGLRFRYHDDIPLIEDWNFRVKPGETVALVGASGSGKTSFMNLLLGLFDEYEGSIRLNGRELRDFRLDASRSVMGAVFQEQILFSASIRENLLLGVPDGVEVTEDQLWEALDMAHARGFIESMPEALDTLVGVNGVTLSGGQRQRLALARVVLKNPSLLLLDEATSALDSISEGHVQNALKDLFHDRTSLVIAHRLSTITEADLVLVLHDGRIAEAGTHVKLIEKGGIYSRLYEAQLGGGGFLDWELIQQNGNPAAGKAPGNGGERGRGS